MREDNFAIRTVKDGAVQIYGKVFVPDEMPPSHFEGMRFAFGRYKTGNQYTDFVCLWGTEAEYRDHNINEHHLYTEDGTYKWLWWHTQKENEQ